MKPLNPNNLNSSGSTQADLFPIPQSLILQLGTISLMGAVLVHKSLAETIVSISQGSEEIFRGDRLPILPFPDRNNATDNTTTKR